MKLSELNAIKPLAKRNYLDLVLVWFDGAPVKSEADAAHYIDAFSKLKDLLGITASKLPRRLYKSVRQQSPPKKLNSSAVTKGFIQSWSDEIYSVEEFSRKKRNSSLLLESSAPGSVLLYHYSWDKKLAAVLGELNTPVAKQLVQMRRQYASENEVLIHVPSGKLPGKVIKVLDYVDPGEGKPYDPYDPARIDWGEG